MSSHNGVSGSPDRYSFLEDSGVCLPRKLDSASSASSSSIMKPPSVQKKRILNYKAMSRKPTTLLGPTALPFPSEYYDPHSDAPYMYQCFDVLDKIGEGCFGTVYKVRSKDDDELYAIKKSEIVNNSLNMKQAKNEGRFQFQLCGHPYIVKVYQAWEEMGCVYLQLELCTQSLEDFAQSTHDVDERTVMKVLLEMCSALRYIHANGFIHLDVKPANIMISRDGTCKLGDFGLITNLRDRSTKNIDEGDSKYLAAEVLSHRYTQAADIFSLGISVLELACDLVLPSNGDSWQLLRHDKIPKNLPTKVSDRVVQIIVSMMARDWRSRPTAQQVIDELRATIKDVQQEETVEPAPQPPITTPSTLYASLRDVIIFGYQTLIAKVAGVLEYLNDLFAPKEYAIQELQANPIRTSTPLSGAGGSRPTVVNRKLAFAISDEDSN
ncbi:hypothetical protein LSTR_LSTR007004 [Laodelphax striatellus]|uniref:non-specific serine/threonine protein kinase n=1 Tax=Laodelphax striatellus TaxID=195883 RepID=A0A482WK60_LAOST|nr:hypothetical protein LSTR_LSTR007004 [Laodelphax striatellus]